ncbi:MAG: NADPH-dependent FMN reductase [Candidatus Gottesmanbacteria bacterium GW2011_GWB1_49_7]|uniref:NADPH-dependent FMN reductase n=1 Tax=Candidatus Gottesmanbacteria bacterium GW2011_GWB1_49_7 TaxID=1618448 RepID=A0A0G1Z2E6_9BACT|nr:MAG: NADPH-dependent FMN reductase [Candidatus Gottesmanbacteria bacterium GW2011_GWB1_49_7]
MSEKVAPWVLAEAKKHTEAEFELIDLRDWPLPFYNEPTSVTGLTKYSIPLAEKWSEKIRQGDGFLIVTPEYNHGYSAVLKNALDYLYTEWHRKPVAFVSYGGPVGGSRAVEQLRLVSIELKMVPVRESKVRTG